MLRVYFSDVGALDEKEKYRTWYSSLTEERKAKTDRLRFDKDKKLSVGAGALLSNALEDVGFDMTGKMTVTDAFGKPHFGDDSIFFNISHSEKKVMCAVSDLPVGCDVEYVGKYKDDLAKRYLHEKEYADLCALETEEEKRQMFYEIWTRKESFVKAVGLGLRIPFDSFSISFDSSLPVEQTACDTLFFTNTFRLDENYKFSVASPYMTVDEIKKIDL